MSYGKVVSLGASIDSSLINTLWQLIGYRCYSVILVTLYCVMKLTYAVLCSQRFNARGRSRSRESETPVFHGYLKGCGYLHAGRRLSAGVGRHRALADLPEAAAAADAVLHALPLCWL